MHAVHGASQRCTGGAHGAIKACFLLLTTCTRVQTVLLHPYTRTGGMTPSVQLYTADGSTRSAVQPTSPQLHKCACRAMPAARVDSPNNPRRIAVRMGSHKRHSCADRLTRNVGLYISARTERTAVRSGSLGAHGRSGWCTGHARACASGSAVVTRVLPLIRCRVGGILRDLNNAARPFEIQF